MLNADQIRTKFEDSGFLTLDDSDYDSLFLAAGDSDDLEDICVEFDTYFEQVNEDFVAVFHR